MLFRCDASTLLFTLVEISFIWPHSGRDAVKLENIRDKVRWMTGYNVTNFGFMANKMSPVVSKAHCLSNIMFHNSSSNYYIISLFVDTFFTSTAQLLIMFVNRWTMSKQTNEKRRNWTKKLKPFFSFQSSILLNFFTFLFIFRK